MMYVRYAVNICAKSKYSCIDVSNIESINSSDIY